MSWFGNRRSSPIARRRSPVTSAQYAELAKRGPQDTDLRPILPALDTLRNMQGGYADRTKSVPIALTFGLYQGDEARRRVDRCL